MNSVSIRGEWVGRTIDHRFPLIAWLGGSGSTGVFLTEIVDDHGQPLADRESSNPGPRKATIKLIAASAQAEDRLAMWNRAAALSHPHLVSILHSGRAEVDESQIIYVVSELAEEILAQIIPERALNPDETREMLVPILDALAYLHGSGYIHAHLKPSNILVVENEVKLSSDRLLVAGKPATESFSNDLHNAPEIFSGPVTAAADIWSLGVTLVEALAQQLPIWDAATDANAEVPASMPKPFTEIVDGCLHADPARRCTLNDVRDMLDGKQKPHVKPMVEPVTHSPKHQHRLAERAGPSKIPLVPLIVGFALLIAIFIGLEMRSHKTQPAPVQTEVAQQAPPAEPESGGAAQPAPNATVQAEVLNRAMPDVPREASNTIHGTVSVSVRITADETGTVSNAELASRGPSAYFARLAVESARNWKFKPAQKNGRSVASTWMLHYQFRREGTDVKPAQIAP